MIISLSLVLEVSFAGLTIIEGECAAVAAGGQLLGNANNQAVIDYLSRMPHNQANGAQHPLQPEEDNTYPDFVKFLPSLTDRAPFDGKILWDIPVGWRLNAQNSAWHDGLGKAPMTVDISGHQTNQPTVKLKKLEAQAP